MSSNLASASVNKLRGGYYTPQSVAQWLADWAIRTGRDRVLEPSSGDGVFLSAAISTLRGFGGPVGARQVTGIELEPREAESALQRVAGLGDVLAADFFGWLAGQELAAFDVVLGNPPFIRYQHFPEPSRTRAMRFMERQGLRPNRLTNIWVPFVVAGSALLREGGRLGMVLPAELLQVSYAAQLRQYLAESFRQITILACNQMFFAGAEQEVVLVAADGKLRRSEAQNRCAVSLIEANSLSEILDRPSLTKAAEASGKFVEHGSEKWLKYFLDVREIDFMRTLRNHPHVTTLADHASVDVGVVTGRNEFFVLTGAEVRAFGLEEFIVPLVGRSAQLRGAMLRAREHDELARSGHRVHLLHLTGHCDRQFPAGLRSYIKSAEARGYHKGFKCRIRHPWYRVPSVWEPDCFLFRQIYDFPRIVLNRARATSTDTIHRVRCVGNPARFASNLYTHLTAASAEIEGRSYGGGVLELEPTEAERLLVPKKLNGAVPLAEADSLIREGRLSDVLEQNDRAVLVDALGLSQRECNLLRKVWAKMRDRRRSRRRAC